MKVRDVACTPFRLALRRPLRTARGIVRERRGLLLRIGCEGGITGVGEASPLPGFGGEPLDVCWSALQDAAARLRGACVVPDDVDALSAALPQAPAARSALDAALHDAEARARGIRVAALLSGPGAEPRASVPVNALLDGEAPAALAEAARRARRCGYGTLKLKGGVGGAAADVARVRAVREAVGPEVGIRLDANGAWTEAEALRVLEALAPLAPEYVEAPLATRDPAAWARLRARSPVPLAADEAIRDEDDARRFLEAGACDVLVLKPAWLGGLRSAGRVAARAAAAGAAVVVTSALDAAVGRAAALHLAAALGGPRAAGLATGDRLAEDLARLPEPRDGALRLPDGPGLGVAP